MTFNATILAYMQLVRLPAVFTAFSNILAAHLVVSGADIHWSALAFLSASSANIYLGGMVLNDCFDLEVDRHERPHRPLPSGQIDTRHAWWLGWSLLLAGVAFASMVGWTAFFISVLLIAAVILYDSFAKNTDFGPVVMGACRYLNWLLGFSFLALNFESFQIAAPIFLYIFALTLVSRQEAKALNARPLVISWTMMLATLMIYLLFVVGDLLAGYAVVTLSVFAFSVLSFYFYRTVKKFSSTSVQHLVKVLILGVIPLDALVVLSRGPWWGAIVIMTLLIPGKLLAKKMYVT